MFLFKFFRLKFVVRLVPLSLREGTSPIITIAIIVRDPSNSSQETAGPQSPKKLGAHQQQPVKQVWKAKQKKTYTSLNCDCNLFDLHH